MVKIILASALGALFAVAVILAVFMPWVQTVDLLGISSTDHSGWNIFNKEGNLLDNFEYYYLPIIVAALAALSLLTFLVIPKGNVTVLLLVVFGLAIIAATYLTYYQFNAYIQDNLITSVIYDVKMVWGMFLSIGAGAGVLICGALARE